MVKTTFNPSRIPGLVNEINRTKKLGRLDLLDTEWTSYVETGTSNGYQFELPSYTCNPIPEIKVLILQAVHDFCPLAEKNHQLILEKQGNTDLSVPADVQQQIQWLTDTLSNKKEREDQLKMAWSQLNAGNAVDDNITYSYLFPCNRELDIKAVLLDGFKDVCQNGRKSLEQAQTIKDQYQPELSQSTRDKWKELTGLVNEEDKNIAYLETFWYDFLPDNAIDHSIDFSFTYCDPINTSKAYLIDGMVHFCEKGKQRRADIQNTLNDYEGNLPTDLSDKINVLDQRLALEALKVDQLIVLGISMSFTIPLPFRWRTFPQKTPPYLK